MKLYVGNISFDASEADLKDLFASKGEVISVKLITDKFSGRSKGFAFVEYTNKNDAETAISEYDGFEFKGRPMKVNPARDKNDRPGGGGRSFRD